MKFHQSGNKANMTASKVVIKTGVSYWQVFRLVFVLFSLYLMRDAFFRWDGFRYHSTFLEFLPSVALIAILWSLVAVFVAMFIWLLLKALAWSFSFVKWKITTEHLIFFAGASVLLIAMIWVGKRLVWPNTPIPQLLKYFVILASALAAIFLTWSFRNKPDIIHERITPLVWLFGIFFLISVPIVIYQTWLKQPNGGILQKNSQSSEADKIRPNIILVTFDALTARDMSLYGYHRPTTPFISEWAKEATTFTKAEAGSNWTRPTVAGLMTGKRMWTHRVFHFEGQLVKEDIENLPLVLKSNGYYNMAFIVNGWASVHKLGISNRFDIVPSTKQFHNTLTLYTTVHQFLSHLYYDKIKMYNWIIKLDFILGKLLYKITQDSSVTEVPPSIAFDRFFEVIDDNYPEPFFAWIHLFPPHDPYLPP
jgi:hypothetical protein